MKKSAVLWILLFAAVLPSLAEEVPPVKAAFYYKVKWGFQDEFEALFFRNYYPVIQAQISEGKRVQAVEIYRPTHHGDGRADWTFLVVLTYTSIEASVALSHDDVLIRRLFPDQARYRKEEARRFEILAAHWDVPLTAVIPPDKR